MLKLAKASHIYLKITFDDILCLYCGFYVNATNTHIFNHNEHFAFIYCILHILRAFMKTIGSCRSLQVEIQNCLTLLIEYQRAVALTGSIL